jgi:hypothetical protein
MNLASNTARLRLDLTAFLRPKADEGGLVIAHDDPGVRTANKRAPRTGGINR